jgi:integrase
VVHDCGPNQSEDGTGWIEIFGAAKGARAAKNEAGDASGAENKGGSDVSRAAKEGGLLLTINGKTGWREVEIGRGSSALTCPVAMLETWMRLGRVADGPLFRRVTKKNTGVTSERLTDKHVARLVQKTALAAGIRGDLSEGERKLAFSGHSLRAGLASSAKIEEAHVQRHLGHASAEMTRRYQRKRDRFKVNLTRAAGL